MMSLVAYYMLIWC